MSNKSKHSPLSPPSLIEPGKGSMPGITDLMFPPGLKGEAARKLGDLFGRARANLENSVRASGISFAQMHLLVGLAMMGKCRLVDLLAVHGGSTKQNLASLVSKLVRAGLVISEPDDRDGRSKLLSLSASGEQMVREHTPTHRDALGRLFGKLKEEDLKTLIGLLDRLNEGFAEQEDSR